MHAGLVNEELKKGPIRCGNHWDITASLSRAFFVTSNLHIGPELQSPEQSSIDISIVLVFTCVQYHHRDCIISDYSTNNLNFEHRASPQESSPRSSQFWVPNRYCTAIRFEEISSIPTQLHKHLISPTNFDILHNN